MVNESELSTQVIAETENYLAWEANEPDEKTFHIDINNVTVHFFKEEWEEFLLLVKMILEKK
jgi:hypothetical protein